MVRAIALLFLGVISAQAGLISGGQGAGGVSASSAAATYVNKAGDTMTGGLSTPRLSVPSASSPGQYVIAISSQDGTGLLSISGNGALTFNNSAVGSSVTIYGTGSGDAVKVIGGKIWASGTGANSGYDFNDHVLYEESATRLHLQVGATHYVWDTSGGMGLNLGTAQIPATQLEVNGAASFGTEAKKSTFTVLGSLVMASSASITATGSVTVGVSGASVTINAGTNNTGLYVVQTDNTSSDSPGAGGIQVLDPTETTQINIRTKHTAGAMSGSTDVGQISGTGLNGLEIFTNGNSFVAIGAAQIEAIRILGTNRNVGIKTTTPNTDLQVVGGFRASSITISNTGTPSGFALNVSSTNGTMMLAVDGAGHIVSSGTAPSIGTCGTGPTIDGTDTAGAFIPGGTPGTGCVVTFAQPYQSRAPSCFCNDSGSAVACRVSAVSTTAFTATAVFTSGDTVQYICLGGR